jgi:hypothetical protein
MVLRPVTVALLVAGALLITLWGCANAGAGGGGDDSIPAGVLELAGGLMEDVVGGVLQYGSEGPEGGWSGQSGTMSVVAQVEVGSSDISGYEITFTDFVPEPDAGTVEGTITIAFPDNHTLRLTGSLTLTGMEYSSVVMDATANWTAAVFENASENGLPADPGEPESVSGTFTIDGSAYSFEEILREISQ